MVVVLLWVTYSCIFLSFGLKRENKVYASILKVVTCALTFIAQYSLLKLFSVSWQVQGNSQMSEDTSDVSRIEMTEVF